MAISGNSERAALLQSDCSSIAVGLQSLCLQCSIIAIVVMVSLSTLICESLNLSLMPRCCWCVLPVRLVFLSISSA